MILMLFVGNPYLMKSKGKQFGVRVLIKLALLSCEHPWMNHLVSLNLGFFVSFSNNGYVSASL